MPTVDIIHRSSNLSLKSKWAKKVTEKKKKKDFLPLTLYLLLENESKLGSF